MKDVVNNSGSVINHMVYDAFGNVVSQTNSAVETRYRFTGREFDAESQLYYYRARYYDAGSGKFISADPIGIQSGDANFYRYLQNNPVDSTDPTGLQDFGEFSGQVAVKIAPKVIKAFDETKRFKDLKKIDASCKAKKEVEILEKDAEKTAKVIEKDFVTKIFEYLFTPANDALVGK